MLMQKEQKFLLKLARDTITNHSNAPGSDIGSIPEILNEKHGVFVSLHINGQLRGCIGCISPIKSLYESVIENAVNAAYSDPRFPPLSKNEFDKIKIEISVLTEPQKLYYASPDGLLKKLDPDDGVIIKKGYRSATFLPQVWEQLPDKEEFLAHLCLKAGLNPNAWEEDNIEIQVYKVEKFEE